MSDATRSGADLVAKTYHALQARLDQLRAKPRTPTQWLNLALWLLYLGCYPIAVIGVAFDVRPGFSMAWAGSVLLFMQGALAVLWLVVRLGWRRGGALALAIGLGGYLGETLGVTTGFPFGPYSYAAILFPRLPGTVPLPVICAWLVVVTTAIAIARWLSPEDATHRRLSRWRQVGLATALGVGLDLVLEPVAVRLQHYWVWHATGPYYGIPTTNFLGWAALCALLAGVVIAAWPRGGTASPPNPLSIFARRGGTHCQHSRFVGTKQVPAISPSPLQMERGPGGEAAPLGSDLQRAEQPNSFASSEGGAILPMLALYMLTAAMFGVVDLTHGLLIAALISSALIASLALRWRATYHIAEGTRAMS